LAKSGRAVASTTLTAIADASPRVVAGTLATSWQGRPLEYAIVGKPGDVTPSGLARVRQAAARLRDPNTPAKEARQLLLTTPAIVWVTGNVHGNEESGADAALRTPCSTWPIGTTARPARSSTTPSW
jgi:hypothetical protein